MAAQTFIIKTPISGTGSVKEHLPKNKSALNSKEIPATASGFSLQNFLTGPGKVKEEDLYTFTHQISILLESGVPLLLGLEIVTDQIENKHLKTTIEKVTLEIKSGQSFSQSLANHPAAFPPLFVSMVHAGEKSGQLVGILKQLGSYLNEQNKLQKKLKSVLAYPKFMFGFMFLLLTAILFALVPKFQEIFATFDAELPGPTLFLISLSQALKNHIIFEIIAVVFLIIAFKKLSKTKYGEHLIDKFKLKIPLLGDVILKTILARFCKTLSILIKSGVPLVEAIELAAATTQNTHFDRALKNVKTGVTAGDSFYKKLNQFSIFPPMVVSMVHTGEQSGSLDQMLESISKLFETYVDSKISGLLTLIEPALMISMGIITLVVIVALYLPIFQMSGVVQ